MAENQKEFNLSKSREIVKQILQGVYTGSENHRIIDLIFANVETQDKEFIKLLKDEMGNTYRGLRDWDLQIFYKAIDKLAGKSLI